jgi:hypothetical protein
MMGPWAYATHLMSTPRLPFTAAYFGSIALTLYFSLGVSIPNISFGQLANLNWHAAPKHSSDTDIRYCTIGMLALVLGQLFPDGFQWSSISDLLWCTTGCGMDDRVEMDAGRITVLVLFWSAHYISTLRPSRSAPQFLLFGTHLMRPPRYHVTINPLIESAQHEAASFDNETVTFQMRFS